MLRHTAALGAALLALTVTRPALAQSSCNTNGCTVTNVASVNVPSIVRLSSSSDATTLTAPTDADFGTSQTAQITEGAGNATLPTITVVANRTWGLTISTTDTKWAYTPSGTYTDPNKAVGDLEWSTDGATFSALSSTPADIQAAGTGSAGKTTFPITYRTDYDLSKDVPGSYSINVIFTLSAP